MNTLQLVTALESFVALMLLWVLVCVFWKDYCLDNFRQSLFKLRDELFTYAAEGNIGFDHPAYRLLRGRMNASIRYGHQFTMTRFIVAGLIMSRHDVQTESDTWMINTATLNSETRAVLDCYRAAYAFNVLKFMMLRSFFLALLILCGRAISQAKDAFKRRRTAQVVALVERIESETIENGYEPGEMPVGA